jgi:hypothetical protein
MADTNGMQRPDALDFPEVIRTRAQGLRAAVRNVPEAIRMIDKELPEELRGRSRWTFARALLREAELSGKKRDVTTAARQLRQALSNEGWLDETDEDARHRGK